LLVWLGRRLGTRIGDESRVGRTVRGLIDKVGETWGAAGCALFVFSWVGAGLRGVYVNAVVVES